MGTAVGPKTDLAIVIVTWQSGEDFSRCLRSLAAARKRCPHRLELVVVDNGSPPEVVEQVKAWWAEATLLKNPANRGFAAAANQGARLAAADILFFLNPDTEAVGDPFSPLLYGFAAHPDAVALAPRLDDAETVEEPHATFQLRRLPHWGQAVRELLLIDKAFPRNRFFVHDRYLDHPRGRAFPVEQPAAAALAVRRAVFWEVGGFDEAFFPAWFEDVDLCSRLLGKGTILFWPASRFLHIGGRAKGALGYDVFLPIYYRNAIRYWRKHKGSVASIVYRALVALGMVFRVLALPFRGDLPRHRSEAFRAYLKTLKAALVPLPKAPNPPAGCE